MQNRVIKIALSSVLIYLSFKKIYDILITFLLWIIAEFQIENDYILFSLNAVLGLLALLFLIALSKRVLNKRRIESRVMYFLLLLTIFLSVIRSIVSKLHANYLVNYDLGEFENIYLSQYSWTYGLEGIFPVFGLLYFLWKLKKNNLAKQGKAGN